MSMAAKPNGGWHPYESPHEQKRMARAVAAVCSMGRFIFLCGSPDQNAALHDNIPARWITRRDPERVVKQSCGKPDSGLLHGARHRACIRATRWLATTI